ncbi:MAG: IS110 family transposase [Bacteroidales bacterium]|nr:IS110 family transposase [Bacteroidales bacterium]
MNKKWFIGIDVAKLTLDVAIHSEDGKLDENYKRVINDIKGFNDLLKWLQKKRIECSETIFCMEHTGVYGLEIQSFFERNGIDYCVESPLQIKRSLGLVRGKNDKIDAFRIAWYAYTFRKKIKMSHLPHETITNLHKLLIERKHYVRQIASYKQQVSDLMKYETAQAVQRKQKVMSHLSEVLSDVESQINAMVTLDTEIRHNYKLLLTVPGIGHINAITTIVNTQNFTSFNNARQYACYIGVAPFEHTSGISINGKTRVSKLGNKQAKVELTQAARSAVVHDPGIKAYFWRKFSEKGSTRDAYGVVLNAVKFKLLLRMFAVVKRDSGYIKLAYA